MEQIKQSMSDTLFYAAQELNFRELRTSGIARNTIYRCSHPALGGKIDPTIAVLAKGAKIASIINLCDNEEELKRNAPPKSWYKKIVDADNAIALDMQFNFRQGEFTQKLKRSLQFMTISPAPFFVHCYAGFDRTGIFCAILEALMGASKKEIGGDYSLSYNSNQDSEFYEFANKDHSHIILRQLEELYGTNFTDENLQDITEETLIKKVSLSEREINMLKQKLSKSLDTQA